MLRVSKLFVYPIKSLGGVELTSAKVTDRGFEHDRRWMLVDGANRFLSQREFAQMALLRVNILADGLLVSHLTSADQLLIPFVPQTNQTGQFTVWDDTCMGQYVSAKADEWFSRMLGATCRLVYMPDDSQRIVDPEAKYVASRKITSFSDAYPFLLLGQASMDDLNARLPEQIPLNRFRANLVLPEANLTRKIPWRILK